MTKKKSMRVDFVKSCITYNKLNTIAKITISGIENICKRLDLGSIYDVINGRFAIPSKKLSGKKSSSSVLQNAIPYLWLTDSAVIRQKSRHQT